MRGGGSPPDLVPQPVRVIEVRAKPVVLASPVTVAAGAGLTSETRWFRRVLGEGTGMDVEFVPPSGPAVVRLETGGPGPSGAYRLAAGDGRIAVTGADAAGVFYGLQTLRQLMPDATLRRAPTGRAGRGEAGEPPVVAAIVVEDSPRCSWRGVHLDVARHFMPKDFVLKLIDVAAFHKCNVLHLHLTDDQGWRVPIDRYPRLTEIGAWRRESPVGHARERRFDGIPHGGHYTKEDVREIVSFARERHVTVLPEVDMPGHMVAAIAAYPELGNVDERLEVGTRWGVSPHVLNLDEQTIDWCTGVIDEVADLFPGAWFHAGGDECPSDEWGASARGKALMDEQGFTSLRQLQGWFTARIASHLARRGRTMVGWDEILDAGAPPGAIVMSWRGEAGGIAAATAGHDVVMTPERWLYFDWAQSDDPAEPLSIRGATSLERVYAYDPVPPQVPEERQHHVLGAQCQLWTEYVATPERAEYQYFPRLCAFAETVWSPRPPSPDGDTARSYAEFLPRLARHLDRLSALGVNFRPLDGPTPGQARLWRPLLTSTDG